MIDWPQEPLKQAAVAAREGRLSGERVGVALGGRKQRGVVGVETNADAGTSCQARR